MKIWIRETEGRFRPLGRFLRVKSQGLKVSGRAGRKSGRVGRGLKEGGVTAAWGWGLQVGVPWREGRALEEGACPGGGRALAEGRALRAGSGQWRAAAAASAEDGCGRGGGHSADARSRADR